MDILQYAESGTYWKRIIYDIMNSEGFDPWDIDVGGLTDSYLEKIKQMKMINFEVPGTIILVGSVLLKLKSDIVSGKTFSFEESLSEGEDEGGMDDDMSADLDDITGEALPPSSLDDGEPNIFVRRIPKRKVTLPELMVFLKRVVNQVERKGRRISETAERKVEVQISKKNVERIMREVYREIRRLSGKEKTTFKKLVAEWKRENIIAYFMPVLHLANKDKIDITQEELFGDITISPKSNG